jgi:glycosyltransferase involved in cell wall biosynthesis
MKPSVRVLVDGKGLYDDSRFRGIGRYLRNVVAGMASRDGFEVSVLVRRGTPLPGGAAPIIVTRRAPGRWASREHDFLLPRDLSRVDFDVFHSPALDPPRRCNRPWVQTLHDVAPLVMNTPESSPEWSSVSQRWQRQRPLFQQAAAVIAVSKWSAGRGIEQLGLDPKNVHVIHHGVGPAFRPATTSGGADPPFVLLVGEFDPRKGYDVAMEVIARLADDGRPHQLKIVGRIAPWIRARLEETVAASRRPDRVQLLGYVEGDEALADLYRAASAVIVTSRDEGFGFPAVEAMACGTPVLAFANTSITEVVGDGGLLVNDGDVEAMTNALRTLLDSPARAAELSERALERARHFSWARSVSEHAEVLANAARLG